MRAIVLTLCVLFFACSQLTLQPSVGAALLSPSRASAEARSVQPAAPALSDHEIALLLIAQSLADYPGNCPCPYNVDRRGHSCGGRSAYSRPAVQLRDATSAISRRA